MFTKTLSYSLITAAWLLAAFAVYTWSLQAPFGSFWHMDDVAMYAAVANGLFITALVYLDESFGLRK